MEILYLFIGGLVGYFFGAIPFGFLFVRVTKGIDLREVGSGRTGGTNSMRAAGPVVGALTGLSDVLKGACAIWLARFLFGNVLSSDWLPWAELMTAVMSIIGHNWSIFLKFKGGAGTGPNIGWATAIWWPMFPIGLLVVLGVGYLTGMASVASLAMAITIPTIFVIRFLSGDAALAYVVAGMLTALVVAWALRPNIKRLLNGTERVVGPAAKRRELRAQRTQG